MNTIFEQQETPSLVLVVDDDQGMRHLLRQQMEMQGYQVIEAENCSQALSTYQEVYPDVILLDICMPGMDGITCCRELSSLDQERQSLILMTTMHSDELSINHAFEAGAIDYVTKPINWTILRQRVRRLIQQARLTKKLYEYNLELEDYAITKNATTRKKSAQIYKALELESILKRITDKVRETLDEAIVLQTAVQELVEALDIGSCIASVYDDNQQISQGLYEHHNWNSDCPNYTLHSHEFPEVRHLLRQGSSVHFCIVSPSLVQEPLSLFAFPMRNGHPVGDLWLVSKGEQVLDELEIRLVEQVTNQCAIGIRQARLYQAAQVQVRELERLNHLKEDFLSTVSHELRSPMANIQVATQMLDWLATQAQEQYGEALLQNSIYQKGCTYLQIIQKECDREIDIINDLLDLQRLESGKQPINSTVIDLELWLAHLVQPFEERTQQRQQILHRFVAVDLQCIQSDPNSLNRIMTELLHNACKYTPPGETITVSITAHPNSDLFQIRVTNTGVEIPIEEQNSIFDKFYRIPHSDLWSQGGTGLGLTLVKQLVICLGGTIQVQSGDLQTCFIVQLPYRMLDSTDKM